MEEPGEAPTAAQMFATMAFAGLLGVEALEATKELVRARVAWGDRALHVRRHPARRGADGAGRLLRRRGGLSQPARGRLGHEHGRVKTNFLRGVREGFVTATARPLHAGRRFIVIETELRDEAGALVGKVTQTQAVL